MNSMLRLVKGSPERQAIHAGEIDAIIDYSSKNVILLPAARRALRLAARAAAPIANGILAALPPADYQALLPGLEPRTVKLGEVLGEPGVPVGFVYFPVDCMITLLTTENDRAVDVGLVGYEGFVGISLVLGAEVPSVRAVVQASGTALRMRAASFVETFRQSLPLQRVLLRYAHAELVEARQMAVCRFFHEIEARLARRLLVTSDLVRSPEFVLTQALLAKMLGVRRAAINEAAGTLQQRKLINYCRGAITILDRAGMEAASCRCYSRTLEPGEQIEQRIRRT
jgi:CRP-like cAMP-binding protein